MNSFKTWFHKHKSIRKVSSFEQLGCYLERHTARLVRKSIGYHQRTTYGIWRVHIISFKSHKQQSIAILNAVYPITLTDLWLYSLSKLLPLAENSYDRESLHLYITHLFRLSLHSYSQVRNTINIPLAQNIFRTTLDKNIHCNTHSDTFLDNVRSHIQEQITTRYSSDASVVAGKLRLLTLELSEDWYQAVITEAILQDMYRIKPQIQQTTRIDAASTGS